MVMVEEEEKDLRPKQAALWLWFSPRPLSQLHASPEGPTTPICVQHTDVRAGLQSKHETEDLLGCSMQADLNKAPALPDILLPSRLGPQSPQDCSGWTIRCRSQCQEGTMACLQQLALLLPFPSCKHSQASCGLQAPPHPAHQPVVLQLNSGSDLRCAANSSVLASGRMGVGDVEY